MKFEKQAALSPNCTEEAYRAHVALGSTDIKTIYENPLEFYSRRMGYIEEDLQKHAFGKALHCYLLEPKEFKNRFFVVEKISERLQKIANRNEFLIADCKGKTAKVFKQMAEDNPNKDIVTVPEFQHIEKLLDARGKVLLTNEDFEQVKIVAQKFLALRSFKRLLENGFSEQAFFGELDGVQVKARIDLMYYHDKDSKGIIVVDLKTTQNKNSASVFAKQSAAFCYYVQQYLYMQILKQNGFKIDNKNYYNAMASLVEWSGASYNRHNEMYEEAAEQFVNSAIAKFKNCARSGIWSENEYDFANDEFMPVNEVILPNYVFYR